MQLSDKIKKFSVEQAIDYLNRNPVKNLPKLLDWADTFCAGKFEGQRRAISLEGDETTTDSRRGEKEVKRAQKTKKHRLPVGRRCFPAFPSRERPGHTVPHREKRHQRCRCCAA
ncbi:MAG: hypothetical protein ACLRXG_10825 [Oscillospiraceae bacterium]